MPVHDWTRVDDGTFHSFHNGWIAHLSESLNAGLLARDANLQTWEVDQLLFGFTDYFIAAIRW